MSARVFIVYCFIWIEKKRKKKWNLFGSFIFFWTNQTMADTGKAINYKFNLILICGFCDRGLQYCFWIAVSYDKSGDLMVYVAAAHVFRCWIFFFAFRSVRRRLRFFRAKYSLDFICLAEKYSSFVEMANYSAAIIRCTNNLLFRHSTT